MNLRNVPLVLSLLIVMFMLGLLTGFFISPEYQQQMYAKADMNLGIADRYVDLRYINAMIAHHRGAILLAQQIGQKSKRTELLSLSQAIQADEPKAIDELYGWKKSWFNDNRPVLVPVVAQLGPADDTVDLRFLNALISHHEAGLIMTKEIRTKSSRKEVLDNADAVETFLTKSLVTLRDWRKQWYNL